jgi:hypothetical protein
MNVQSCKGLALTDGGMPEGVSLISLISLLHCFIDFIASLISLISLFFIRPSDSEGGH